MSEPTKTRNLSYRQRWEMAMERRRKQPPVFAGIQKDEYDRVAPQDFYMTGAPRYEKLTVPMALGMGAMMVIEVLKQGEFNLGAQLLNDLSAAQIVIAIGVSLIVCVLAVLFQTGAFTHFWAQLEPVVIHDPVTDSEDVTAMRIREPPTCLWWPGREKTIEQEMQQQKKGAPPSDPPAQTDKGPNGDKKTAAPPQLGPPGLPDIHLPDMPSGRLSSVNDLITAINGYRNITTVPQIPRGQEVVEIQQRFVDVCRQIRLEYHVNLFRLCGGREIIVVSKNKLIAESPGDSKPEEAVELLRYPREQRTFGWQSKNPGAMRADLSRLCLYTNYTMPPHWRRMFPGWQAQLNLFPVYFLSGSAGQVKMSEKGMIKNLDTIEIQRLQDVVATYQIPLIPQLLDDLKIAVEQLDRKDKAMAKLLEEMDYDLKQAAYYLLSKMSRMPNAGKTGLAKSVRSLLSHNILKLLLYGVLIVAGAFVLVTLFPYVFAPQPTAPGTTVGAFMLGSMQIWERLMEMTRESSRARDMAVGDTTNLMDRFMVFTGIVFPDNPGPAELAYIKSMAEKWLVWALSGRPHPNLALLIHTLIRDIESQQARFCGVPEAKYLDSQSGYPMAAIGRDTDMDMAAGGLNAEAAKIQQQQEAKEKDDDKRGGSTGTRSGR